MTWLLSILAESTPPWKDPCQVRGANRAIEARRWNSIFASSAVVPSLVSLDDVQTTGIMDCTTRKDEKELDPRGRTARIRSHKRAEDIGRGVGHRIIFKVDEYAIGYPVKIHLPFARSFYHARLRVFPQFYCISGSIYSLTYRTSVTTISTSRSS